MIAVWLAVVSSNAVVSCTIRPAKVRSPVASFDGTNQNSGLIAFDETGHGILTRHARERYDALCSIYGSYFIVPVKPGHGISAGPTPDTWRIDPQSLVRFQTMNRWLKEGLPGRE